MICTHELKNMKVYSKNMKFLIPSNKKDPKHGSVIFLISPNMKTSKEMMQLPYCVNRKQFESYYVEKAVNRIVTSESFTSKSNEDYIEEAKLSSKERNALPNGQFGLPSQRKYPLNDTAHVKDAIKKFNHVDEKDEPELARNILAAIDRLKIKDIHVGDDNRFRKYMKPVEELTEASMIDIFAGHLTEDYHFTKYGIINKDQCIYIANDTINESDSAFDTKIKRMIYNDRMKNNKAILDIYSDIKDTTNIKYTYLTLDMYKRKNVFIDTSFYNELFIKNNIFKLDKGVDLYIEYLSRLTDISRLPDYNLKTVFIPVESWKSSTDDTLLDYKDHINPISAIYRLLKTHKHSKLTNMWANYTVLFVGKGGYFKMDMANIEKTDTVKFATNINRLLAKAPIEDDEDTTKDSKDAIAVTIYNNIQSNTGITFKRNLVGDIDDIKDEKPEDEETDGDIAEKKLDDDIERAAEISDSVEDAADALDNPDTAKLIADIAAETGGDTVDITPARAARINKLNSEFESKKVNGIAVKDLLKDAEATKTDEKLEETSLPINSINDEWKHMTFINFEKAYNLNADIVAIIKFFGTRRYPVAVVDMKVEDTSTSEDLVETWTVKMEDSIGSRFSLVFDIPKFIPNSRFMRLRGNDKTINAQLMNIPVVKTDLDTCQLTSNYNKIFISPYGSSAGKSFVITDRIMKTLSKLSDKSKVSVEIGDNSKLAEKYDLPIDYVDLSSNYTRIKFPGGAFIFNQDELYKKFPEQMKKLKPDELAIGYRGNDLIIYQGIGVVSTIIKQILCESDKEFAEVYETTNAGIKYKYSKASILNTKIPVIVVMGYSEGLTTVLKKASISYEIADKKNIRYDKDTEDVIKFNDGCIKYTLNYKSSLLMNGLKECNTEDYSITEMDSRSMWTDFLDIFGGRIKADGLDNFYDLMVDPITERVCPVYNLPVDYIEQLVYANNLLADSKFNRHTDLTGNRYRTNELIAAHTYKCLAKSYSDYRIKLKKTGKAAMTIKQSAIIDSILSDNTTSDLSANNDLSYVETAATVSFKGISGMNSERSYGIDKRTFDNSMQNKLAMSTGFAGTSGVNRQTTINMNVDSSRGYIKPNDKDNNNMNVTNSLCISEAIMPMSSTKDDPFRLAMSFIQNSKHSICSEANDPCLVTTGADDAIGYIAPDIFTVKAKQNGKIIKKTDTYMIIEYKDKSTEYIELNPKTYKNSDGGFYLSIKLDTDLKEGSTVKAGSIIAYNKKMYTKEIGYDDNPTMNRGVLCKVAMLVTDEGFEDSGLNSNYCEKALSRKVTVCVDVALNKQASVYNVLKVGDYVQEGENLLVFQNAFDDDDANALMKTLVDDKDTINELGRIPKKSKVTGQIVDIHISRTCDIDGMSPTLKKLVTDYEKDIEATKKIMQKYDPEKAKTLRSNYKLERTGKLKNLDDGVLIEFYIEFITDFGGGDKNCVNAGNKTVSSGSMPYGLEAYSSYRPNEKIDLLTSINSNNGRMILSNVYIGLISKGLIELDRQVKEIMGVATPDIYDIHEYLHPEITKLQRDQHNHK